MLIRINDVQILNPVKISRRHLSIAATYYRGKLKCAAGAPFKFPMTVQFYIGTADQNWFSVVVLKLGLPVHTEFPCLKIFPLHNFQKRDCPCIITHTFGIGLLLLMNACSIGCIAALIKRWLKLCVVC